MTPIISFSVRPPLEISFSNGLSPTWRRFKQWQIPALEMLILGQTWVPKDGSAGMVYSVVTRKTSGFYCLKDWHHLWSQESSVYQPGTCRVTRWFQPASPDRADPSSGMVLKFLGPWPKVFRKASANDPWHSNGRWLSVNHNHPISSKCFRQVACGWRVIIFVSNREELRRPALWVGGIAA